MADRTVSSICSVLCVLVVPLHSCVPSLHLSLDTTVGLFVSVLTCFFSVLTYLSFSFAQEQFEWFEVGSLLGCLCGYLVGYLGANIKQLKK